MRRAVTALTLLLAAPPAFAVELTDYIGEWRGTGTYSVTGTSESAGRLTCKLGITAPQADMILISGRCAAPEGSRGFKTQVTKTGPDTIAGLELSLKARTSTGTLNSSGLRLDGVDSDGSFFFQLSSPASGAVEMRSSSSTTKKTEAAQVQLKRTK